jgi:hypothetical protein
VIKTGHSVSAVITASKEKTMRKETELKILNRWETHEVNFHLGI